MADIGAADATLTIAYHRNANRSEPVCGSYRDLAQGESVTLTALH